jgi:predicted DNA-binding transcriptional regulator AlpA
MLITQAELAEWLQVSEWTIWAMRRRGELPAAVRVGRMLRWRIGTLEKWLRDNERPASEFDAVFCERAQKCSQGRNKSKKRTGKPRGRPTKREQVEGKS